MTTIHYLGNEFISEDSLAIEIAEKIKYKYPNIKFEKIDTFQKLMSIANNQIFMDVCQGIKKVRLITNTEDFLHIRRTTAHDLDFGFFLQLNKKLGEIKKVRIICLPVEEYDGLLDDVCKIIEEIGEDK